MRGSNNPTGMINGMRVPGRMASGPITGPVNNRTGMTNEMWVPDRIGPVIKTVPVFQARDRVAIGHPIVTGIVRRTTGANSPRVL
jgi:hypothetical protein